MPLCAGCQHEVPADCRLCPACGATLTDPSLQATGPFRAAPNHDTDLPGRLEPGALLGGRYRIVACLGKGGMGEFYRADDLMLGQSVALKFLPSNFADNPDRLARFRQEVKIARQVRRWPWRIASWERVMEGRFRDPLVGRELLLGCVLGLAIHLLLTADALLARWLGWSSGNPLYVFNLTLNEFWGSLFGWAASGILYGLVWYLILFSCSCSFGANGSRPLSSGRWRPFTTCIWVLPWMRR